MEVLAPSLPATTDAGCAAKNNTMGGWLDDVCSLLNMDDEAVLDIQNVPSNSPDTYFSFSAPYSPQSPLSPYTATSSPDLPEAEIFVMDTPLFDESIIDDVDSMLFGDSLVVDPNVLPMLEKIFSSVEYMRSPESPVSPPTEVPDAGQRASKKRKADDGKECKVSDILLPRDQLLVMTSTEIEDYVAKLRSQRSLTVAEEKELKRQRRLIKNREYASQSRSRKKLYVDELEKTMADLRAENTSLKQQVSTLADENKTLKNKISTIATTIKKSSTSLSSSSSGLLNKMTSVGNRGSTKNVAACLLAVMFMVFTFGMFWENEPAAQLFSNHESYNKYITSHRVLLDISVLQAEEAVVERGSPLIAFTEAGSDGGTEEPSTTIATEPSSVMPSTIPPSSIAPSATTPSKKASTFAPSAIKPSAKTPTIAPSAIKPTAASTCSLSTTTLPVIPTISAFTAITTTSNFSATITGFDAFISVCISPSSLPCISNGCA